ncbi:MAG: four helix bundle protein [Proteobacteria bacterium]|nr:four helix bundle protein [Pseudomonadota bacterium]
MNHEKLECYRQLAHVAEEVARRVARWPRGNGYLADQLSRALASAVLNLAEGNGKRRYKTDRRRFFEISLGSIAESSAALDLACAFGLLPKPDRNSLKSRLRLAYIKIRALP